MDNWLDGSLPCRSTTSQLNIDRAGLTTTQRPSLAAHTTKINRSKWYHGKRKKITGSQSWLQPLAYGMPALHERPSCNRTKIKEPEPRSLSQESRHLHEQWDSLVMKHGKLWRRAANDDGTSATLQLIAPREYCSGILAELHDSPTGGHLGMKKMPGCLRQRYYWSEVSADIKQWCTTCRTCAARKTASPHQKAPIGTFKAGEPMQTVAVDILSPLPDTPIRNHYVIIAMDYFKMAEAYAILNQEATTIASKLVTEIFLRFSPPEQLHSDQGRQFQSTLDSPRYPNNNYHTYTAFF